MFKENFQMPIFKTPIQSFEFDMCLYAKEYLKRIECVPVNYEILNLHRKLRKLSFLLKDFDKSSIEKSKRVYILDNRLNILFATIDTGKGIYDYLNKTFKSNYFGKYPIHDEAFYNMSAFNKNANNGIVSENICEDYETLCQNHLVVINNTTLQQLAFTTTFEVVLFLEKFHQYNYISLEAQTSKFFFLGNYE